MLLFHILDLNGEKLAKYKRRLKRIAGLFRMHMHFDDLFIVHNNYTVADPFQILAKLLRIFFAIRVASHNKFGAIGEMDLLIEFRRSIAEEFVRAQVGSIRWRFIYDYFVIFKDGHHTVKDVAQTLAAGIHHAGLLQDGQQLRCFLQCFGSSLADGTPHIDRVVVDLGGRFAFFIGYTGNRQNGPLGRLHNGFVGSFHTDTKRICQFCAIDFFAALYPF